MISKTIQAELDVYRIGEKVRALRTDRGLRLIELGQHTGLSPAMLSKIESGKIVPTLPTLTRIALAFSMGLEHFFNDERGGLTFGITRRDGRVRLPGGKSAKTAPYHFESLDYTVHEPRLNAYLAHFKHVDDPTTHQHGGIEFLYLVQGKLEFTWSGETHILSMGDSVYFDSEIEHSYRSIDGSPCTGVVVTLRP